MLQNIRLERVSSQFYVVCFWCMSTDDIIIIEWGNIRFASHFLSPAVSFVIIHSIDVVCLSNMSSFLFLPRYHCGFGEQMSWQTGHFKLPSFWMAKVLDAFQLFLVQHPPLDVCVIRVIYGAISNKQQKFSYRKTVSEGVLQTLKHTCTHILQIWSTMLCPFFIVVRYECECANMWACIYLCVAMLQYSNNWW